MSNGYNDQTPVDQAQLDELLSVIRPLAIELFALAKKMTVANQLWFSAPSDTATTLANLVNAMDAASQLPNKTTLAGADSVTKESLQTLMSYVGAVAAFNDAAHINVMLPFCGSPNLL